MVQFLPRKVSVDTEALHRCKMEKTILENLDAAVLLFDRKLSLRYINLAGEMMFSVSARHIMGQNACDLIQCRDSMSAVFAGTLELGHPYTEREISLSLPDGREITVDCTVIPIRSGDCVSEILVKLQQIDRRLRISREEQLLAQHQAARALVRGLAHEIKNPLGGLRGAAQLLERELPDASLHEYTQIIINEADRLKALLNRMLGPIRLPEKEQVNLHEVLERVRNLIQVEFADRVIIDRDYDPSIPPLWAHSDQLIQALLNIARNGAKATAETGGRLSLRTRVLRQFTIGNQRYPLVAQVEITDNGPGISSELQSRIFYPMVTGSKGGMGLGLSIAQSLVHQYQGLIECRSKPGETVFTVLLPLRNEHGERQDGLGHR